METNAKKKKMSSAAMQQLIITGVLVLVLITLSLLSDRFLTASNMITVIRQAALVMITGAGATMLMSAGHMDLSTGSTLAFAGVLYAKLASGGMGLLPSGVICVALGILVGFVNGICVTKLKITHFIATMGTMYAVRGIAYIICDGISINSGLPRNFDQLGRGLIGGLVPYLIVVTVAILLVFIFSQRKTVLGKYSIAVGGNRTAAVLSGINADRTALRLFMIVGALAAFCGVLMSSRLGAGDPNVANSFHFDVICAIVLGGASLSGGDGSIIGMATGALIIEFLNNGLNIMGVDSFWQDVVKGLVLVLAVILTRTIQNRLKNQ